MQKFNALLASFLVAFCFQVILSTPKAHAVDEGAVGQNPSPIQITLSAIEGATYSEKNMPVRVTFENVSNSNVRLLKAFDPQYTNVFFNFIVKPKSARMLSTPMYTTIHFNENELDYINLKPGETFGVKVDLKEVINPEGRGDKQKIFPGVYRVELLYSNRHGENCFKGNVTSRNTIELNVVE